MTKRASEMTEEEFIHDPAARAEFALVCGLSALELSEEAILKVMAAVQSAQMRIPETMMQERYHLLKAVEQVYATSLAAEPSIGIIRHEDGTVRTYVMLQAVCPPSRNPPFRLPRRDYAD